MVERFDRKPRAGGYERLGFASAFTVLTLDTGAEGAERNSYNALSHEVARWCGRGGEPHFVREQQRSIWQRVVLNALINNSDDHPRNHALIRDGSRWSLAPVFDVVPFAFRGIRRTLTMPFVRGVQDGNLVTPNRLLDAARFFKWDVHEGKAELERMAAVIASEWRPSMSAHGASEETISRRASAFAMSVEIAGGSS